MKMISELSPYKMNVTGSGHMGGKSTEKLSCANSLSWEGTYCILETERPICRDLISERGNNSGKGWKSGIWKFI